MAKIKKLHIVVCSLMLALAGLFLSACGGVDYSKVNLVADQNHLTLNVGEDAVVNFTIQNLQGGMSENLTFSSQGHSITFQPSQPQNGTTAVAIKAVDGGQTILTASSEGQKSCQVIINVQKPSSTFANGTNTLYVTESKTLAPNVSDFKFDADAQLRNLKFNFFGTTSAQAQDLSLDNVRDNNDQFVNDFSKVFLVSSLEEQANFLIFENDQGSFFTIATIDNVQENRNIFYAFIPVEKIGENFDLPQNALKVFAGNKFTFIARYVDNSESELFAQRDFYIYPDLKADEINYSFAYASKQENNEFTDEFDSGNISDLKNSRGIVIIPNGGSLTDNTNYAAVVANFSIPSSQQTKDLIKIETSFANENVANKHSLGESFVDGRTFFTFNITSATTQSLKTYLNVRIFYADLATENDKNVSITFSVPVEIVYKPNEILISGDNSTSDIITLYDKYYDDQTGWKNFYLSLNPTDARYDNISIKFNPKQVNVKYKGKILGDDDVIIMPQTNLAYFEIDDLSQPIALRGLRENGELGSGEVTVTTNYTLTNQESGSLNKNINYNVKKGANQIEYTGDIAETDILYLSLNGDNSGAFNSLVANGEFSSYNISLESGEDVIDITQKTFQNQQLFISFQSKKLGYGVYRVTLDNGVHQVFRVQVVEELKNLTIETIEGGSIVKKCSLLTSTIDNNGNVTFSNEIYLLNGKDTTAEFEIYPNGNKNSTSINQITLSSSQNFAITTNYDFQKTLSLRLTPNSDGHGFVTFTIQSYKTENFKLIATTSTLRINMTSYSFAQSFAISQTKNGQTSPANTINLFAGAPKTENVKLDINVTGGFLFYDPQTENYSPSIFQDRFVYFTSTETIEKTSTSSQNQPTNRIIIDGSSYIIGDNLAIFNTQTMTLSTLSNGNFEFTLYAILDQYAQAQPRIFSINVKISQYVQVQSISTQELVDHLNFSSLETKQEIIVQLSPNNANTKAIKVLYTPAASTNIFEEGISWTAIDEAEGVFLVTLDISKYISKQQENSAPTQRAEAGEEALGGTLLIVPTDWLNDSDILVGSHSPVEIKINYQTGGESNRFILEDANDILAIKQNLSAHYAISTDINISSISSFLPLGKFTGSLVGTNELAKITGIAITNGIEGEYNGQKLFDYGLFTEIAENAYIQDVAFEGFFNIPKDDTNTGRRIGIVAGVNNGRLENISVTFTQNSTIYAKDHQGGLGLRLGGVVGGNNKSGIIIQGHEQGSTSTIKTKNTFYAGTNKITIDASDLSAAAANSSQIRAGGITGRNLGTIKKTSFDQGIGYANYMSYANIEVSNYNLSNVPAGKFAVTDFIGAIAGMNEGGSIYCDTSSQSQTTQSQNQTQSSTSQSLQNETSNIIVGGRLSGYFAVGGVCASFTNADLSNQVIFKNVISRAFVRGYQNIGAISAITNVSSCSMSSLIAQSVDERKIGLDASMLTKILEIAPSQTNPAPKPTNQDVLFGKNASGVSSDTQNALYTYIKRDPQTGEEESVSVYYGDYVEVFIENQNDKAILTFDNQITFAKETLALEVKPNEGFSSFDNENIFYMFYFRAASLNTNSQSVDLAQIQTKIDESLNTVRSTSDLYPILASKEIIFSSSSPILSIDHNGTMTVSGTGRATITGSSVLNANDAMTFTVYITNYFNHNASLGVIYPSRSQTSRPLTTGSSISLKGNNSQTVYVVPNYSYSQQDSLISTDRGVINISNVSVNLSPNETLSAEVNVINASADEQKLLDISVVGQNITFKRNSSLLEDKNFDITLKPLLTVDNSKAYINKEISAKVIYTKGAISITTQNYEMATITTGKTLKDTIIVNSTAQEESPIVEIYDNKGNLVSGDKAQNQLFEIKLSPISNGQLNEQKFGLEVSVNTSSTAYNNRFKQNIYQNYTMLIKAASDQTVSAEISLNYENIPLSTIVIDNYNSRPSQGQALSSTSSTAYPGREGILALTISPDTADFDYILIENDDVNSQAGNGSATFGLLTKSNNQSGEPFINNTISGAITEKGIKLSLADILNAYNTKTTENYHGVVYLRYVVSSQGVREGGISRFKITAVKESGENSFTHTFTKQVDLVLQNHVYISIEGKETADIYRPSYEVARGLRYKINVDSYGFSEDEITITPDDPSLAQIEKENGQYYLVVSSIVDYSENEKDKTTTITVEGRSKDGIKSHSSTMTISIREFIVNFDNSIKNPNIIKGMSDGHINVQIGNIHTIEVDISQYIEFDQTDTAIVKKVQGFMTELRNKGNFTLYTNLNGSVSSGESINPDDNFKGAIDTFTLGKGINFDNVYLAAREFDLTLLRTHVYSQNFFLITYSASFEKDLKGVYKVGGTSEEATNISTIFTYNVYTSSSEKHPIPIDSVKGLNEMQENAHYILMCDLILDPNNFAQLNGNIKSFDGNGYTIYLKSAPNQNVFDFGDQSNLGLFSSISEGTVVKNLTVALTSGSLEGSRNIITFKTSATSFNAGLITGENNGVITNCRVYSSIDTGIRSYLAVQAGTDTTSGGTTGIIAGIAAQNNGYVTHCRSSIHAMGIYDLAGLVGNNNGKISSSYFKEGVLIGHGQNVAGLVLTNGQSGQITTSYSSGQTVNTGLLITDKDAEDGNATYYISSSLEAAGFVYINRGLIENCYSNLKIFGNRMAGFVYRNEGEVKKSFSLSLLKEDSSSSAAFAMDFVDGTQGTFEDCYYFVGEEGGKKYNQNLKPIEFEGAAPLDAAGFANFTARFGEYIYSEALTHGSVWFVSNGDKAYPFDDEQNSFASGRLELVSANIIAFSQKEALSNEVDPTTGDIKYTYKIKDGGNAEGSIKNPLLITDAQSMEDVFSSAYTKINSNNVRIVADIDYSNYAQNSSIYKTIYNATLEGNNMSIRNINLISNESLSSAGMFAQIGLNPTDDTVVMNLDLQPRNVSFPATTAVGGLAGIVRNAKLYNISMTPTNENLIIVGNNFVGGLVGRSEVNSQMINLTSTASVTANFKPQEDTSYAENSGNASSVSYAGSVIGFAGKGEITKVYAQNIKSILGDRAGYVFGGIGSGCNAQNVFAIIDEGSQIKANSYAGMIAGEIAGQLTSSKVYGQTNAVDIFIVAPGFKPIAVGGVAGLSRGGTISNVEVGQSFNVGNYEASIMLTASYIGGIVGYADHSTTVISDSSFTGSIKASGGIVGGAIGQNKQSVFLSKITISGQTLAISGQTENAAIGGIIGRAEGFFTLEESSCTAAIEINIYAHHVTMLAKLSGIANLLLNDDGAPYTIKNCTTSSKISGRVEDFAQVGVGLDNTYTSTTKTAGVTNSTFSGSIDLNHTRGANINIVVTNYGSAQNAS